jgi:NAD(P)H-flavin reductase
MTSSKIAAANGIPNPTVPSNWLSQAYATTRTIARELSYPQGFYFTEKYLTWLTPPPVGSCILIFFYCVTITVMLTTNSISAKSDAYYFERIGFRAAWVGFAQVPFIILLAGKVNVIGFLVGSSYERLNWAHRWCSRTLLVTIAVHAGFFLREWIRADFLAIELQFMPIVKYGLGAGGVLLWMNLSGLAPFRRMWYEFWVIQHLTSIAIFLWLLSLHTPAYARYYLWMSIAFLVFDRAARFVWLFFRNIHFRGGLTIADRVGYQTELHAMPGNVTRVVIKNVPFKWSAGQHVYIWIPIAPFIESHPFTISNIAQSTAAGALPSAELEIRAHSGFSKRIHTLASKKGGTVTQPYTVRSFIQGPFGSYADWASFDTLVLISASTGASFTLPIMESILANPGCVRSMHFLLLVRSRPQCACYLHRLRVAARNQPHSNLKVRIHVAVTRTADLSPEEIFEGDLSSRCCCGVDTDAAGCCCGADDEKRENIGSESSITASDEDDIVASCCAPEPEELTSKGFSEKSPKSFPLEKIESTISSKNSLTETSFSEEDVELLAGDAKDVTFVHRRPKLDRVIRRAVETAHGETGVVVCGGKPLSGHVRNVVAALSDERAVHKGTGAQGIFLHVEEFGF